MSTVCDILSLLEETKNDYWNISRETGDFLEFLIKISKSKSILETGTSNGYSAIRQALALKENGGGRLITVEYWEKRRILARENFEKCGLNDIIVSLQGKAEEVIPEKLQNEKFDFVFMDANKSGYLKIFRQIDKLLTPGGIIVADDVLSHAQSVKPFVDEISNDKNYEVQILNLPDGVLVARKKS